MTMDRQELGILLKEHGDAFAEYVKACSRCGGLWLFHADKTNCPMCETGNLLPVSEYIPIQSEGEGVSE